MASITFNHVVKTFEGRSTKKKSGSDNRITIIPDLNLEIHDKEFLVLVGPSGCGKSTTLRMIAGLEDISGGELYIGDKLVNDVPSKDRDIAMVFQSYALYPHMTVYKNMAFGLELRNTPHEEIQRRVTEAARILELEPYLKRKPRELSGGQRQRVALGRAMVRNPAVFLLDEPLSNLDAKLRTEMRSQIAALHQRLQTTFVYVTHDQTEAMTMGDRIVVMKDGLIQQMDTPQNLYNAPCNVFVAGFIGSPPMNFINALVEKSGSGYALTFAGCRIPTAHPALEAYTGKEVVMGVRPEDIHSAGVLKDGAHLSVHVDMAEMMGSEIYLYFQAAGTKMISRVPSRDNIQSGDDICLSIDPGKVHLFNRDTQEAICH